MIAMLRRAAAVGAASAIAACSLFPSLDEYESNGATSPGGADSSTTSESGAGANLCSAVGSVCDDFEQEVGGWASSGTAPERSSSVTPAPANGAWALHATGDESTPGYREHAVESKAQGAFALRMRILVSKAPGSTSADYADIATLRGNKGARVLLRLEHQPKWKVLLSNSSESGESIEGGATLNRWLCVEIDTLLGDASRGSVRLFVDGISSGTSSFATFASAEDIYDQLRIGILQVSQGAFDAYVDDLVYAQFNVDSLSNAPLIGCN